MISGLWVRANEFRADDFRANEFGLVNFGLTTFGLMNFGLMSFGLMNFGLMHVFPSKAQPHQRRHIWRTVGTISILSQTEVKSEVTIKGETSTSRRKPKLKTIKQSITRQLNSHQDLLVHNTHTTQRQVLSTKLLSRREDKSEHQRDLTRPAIQVSLQPLFLRSVSDQSVLKLK